MERSDSRDVPGKDTGMTPDAVDTARSPQQDTLFDVDGPDQEVGYRVTIACQVAGITYRQLDYWARTKLVQPSIRTAHGSGSQRLYSFRDILVLKIVKGLLDTGISLQNIRRAVDKLGNLGVDDLAGEVVDRIRQEVPAAHRRIEDLQFEDPLRELLGEPAFVIIFVGDVACQILTDSID